jgi:hypothetical protein
MQQQRRSGKKERQDETQFITKIDGFFLGETQFITKN